MHDFNSGTFIQGPYFFFFQFTYCWMNTKIPAIQKLHISWCVHSQLIRKELCYSFAYVSDSETILAMESNSLKDDSPVSCFTNKWAWIW